MAYQVAEIKARPPFAVRVADVETGAPLRMTVYCGEAVVTSQASGLRIITGALPREPCALFVPDAPPVDGQQPVQVAMAEAYLCGVIINGQVQQQAGYGVGEAAAQYVPDPRGGPLRWLQVSFTVTTLVAVRMGYRVTVLGPG
jgi:hypothetical protein